MNHIITISREFGSGGRTVGKKVAEQLGIPCYDSELIQKIAEESGDEQFLEGVRIIEEAYQPEVSKQFIRAERKDRNGSWTPIPLGMTES